MAIRIPGRLPLKNFKAGKFWCLVNCYQIQAGFGVRVVIYMFCICGLIKTAVYINSGEFYSKMQKQGPWLHSIFYFFSAGSNTEAISV